MSRVILFYLFITVLDLSADELVSFYAMGDTPYAIEDHALLIAQLHNLPINDALFAIHLGDIRPEVPNVKSPLIIA